MMSKAKQSSKSSAKHPPRAFRRQSIDGGPLEEREQLDTEFDAVDIDDVVRQARNGRIDVAELDAF